VSNPIGKKHGQSILRLFLLTTASYPHSLMILDPLWIWGSPKGYWSGCGESPDTSLF
jgi:hypothetical protein